MKWDCDEARSVVPMSRHLVANSAGVSVGWLKRGSPPPLGLSTDRLLQDGAKNCRMASLAERTRGPTSMRIKAADDRTPDIRALEALLIRRDVSDDTRRRIEWELRTLQAGIKGEGDAAYEIELTFGRTEHLATIHDLRFEVDGFAAQIDHLVLNRLGEIWVCESKHFAEGVGVNEYGEWVRYWHGRAFGIPSPIEQNERHILQLKRAFDDGLVPLPKRLGLFEMKPVFRNLVLVSNNARINRGRRPSAVQGIEGVIKVERLKATVLEAIDKAPSTRLLRAMGTEGLATFARGLASIHRPHPIDWASRFGIGSAPENQASAPQAAAAAQPASRGAPTDPSGRPCQRCGGQTTFAEVAFCRYNSKRFMGGTYCRSCQPLVAAAT